MVGASWAWGGHGAPAPPLLCCLSRLCCISGAFLSGAESPQPLLRAPGSSWSSPCSQARDSNLNVPSGEGLAGAAGTKSDIFSSIPPQLSIPDLCTWDTALLSSPFLQNLTAMDPCQEPDPLQGFTFPGCSSDRQISLHLVFQTNSLAFSPSIQASLWQDILPGLLSMQTCDLSFLPLGRSPTGFSLLKEMVVARKST